MLSEVLYIGDQLRDLRKRRLLTQEQLAERSVAVLAPVHSTSPKDGAIPKDEFRIDLETDTVTCPQGKTTPIYKPRPSGPSQTGTRVARFSRTDCEPCPLRGRCAPSGRRDIRISRREDLRQLVSQ